MLRRSDGFARKAGLDSVWLTVVLCSVWLCGSAALAAAPMQFGRLGGDNGLSAGGVMAIVQDRQGFLWFGTEDGLDRYDGYELRHHVHDRTRASTLPNNWVSALDVDAGGTLWVGTVGGGILGLDPNTGSFKSLPLIAGIPPVGSQEKVRALHVDRHDLLWIGTRGAGLIAIDRAHRTSKHFGRAGAPEMTLGSDSVLSLLEDRAGMLWVGTSVGLDRLDPATGHVSGQAAMLAQLPAKSPGDSAVNALLEDTQGELWIGTNAGLVRREGSSGTVTVYRNNPADALSLPSDRIQTMFEDDAHRLWIGTSAGLALFDRSAGRFAVYRHNPADVATLPDDNVISIYEDRGGLLWIGTKAGGVAKWNSRSWSFGHQAHESSNGGEAGNVAAFALDGSGTLWISNLGAGLEAIDREQGKTRLYHHLPADPGSLPDDRVMALTVDHEGTLWAGTMNAGLGRFDRNTQRFTTYRFDPQDPTSLGAAGVMSLLEDSRDRIWVGTFGGGVSLLNRATGRFTRYPTDPANPLTPSHDRATALAEDRSGRIWVGTDGAGLGLLDPVTGQMTRFAHDPRNAHTLSADTVYAVRVDDRGRVWVGTRGGGLDEVVGSALDPATVRFRNFSESDGLPNTTIYGIEPDSNGRLWLSTNRGLSRFDPETHEARNFRRSHGLQGDEFNFGAHYRSPDGELFFGGPNGYNAFLPERLQFNDSAPPVVLTSFLKLNEPSPTTVPHEHLRNIALGYRDDIVSFEFAALDFASPEDNRYSYMLEGFDKGWVEAGSKHRVTYTNLAGGNYTFRVRAANSDGKWNEAGLAIPMVVDPAPWATPWAYAGYILGLGLVIFSVWNYQSKKLRREALYAHRLEQDVRDRTAELGKRNEELERVNRQLQQASITDPLTGLGNRRYLCDAMEALLKAVRDEAPGTTPTFSLLIVDLDHLKPVNDLHGHEAGDQILVQVSEIIRHCCRSTDFIARWGGDEFVIVVKNEDLDAAEHLAERIRMRVAKQIFRLGDGKAARTSCSIGFSRYPFVRDAPLALPWEQCLAVADAALYHAKKQRNGWIGWAGTASTGDVESIVRMLERDPEALEREGRLDLRRPSFRPEDTVNEYYGRNVRRGDTQPS